MYFIPLLIILIMLIVSIACPILCLIYIKKFKSYVIWAIALIFICAWYQDQITVYEGAIIPVGPVIIELFLFISAIAFITKTVHFYSIFLKMSWEDLIDNIKSKSTIRFIGIIIIILFSYTFMNQDGLCISDFKKYSEEELVLKKHKDVSDEDLDKLYVFFTKFKSNSLGQSRLFLTTYYEYFAEDYNKILYFKLGRYIDACGNDIGMEHKMAQTSKKGSYAISLRELRNKVQEDSK